MRAEKSLIKARISEKYKKRNIKTNPSHVLSYSKSLKKRRKKENMSSLLRICGSLTREKDEIKWTIHNFSECCKSTECVVRAPYTTPPHGRSLSSLFLVPYEFRASHLEFAFQILTRDAINYELSISIAPSSNTRIESAVFLEGVNVTASSNLRIFAIRGSLARHLVHSRNRYTAVLAIKFLSALPPTAVLDRPRAEEVDSSLDSSECEEPSLDDSPVDVPADQARGSDGEAEEEETSLSRIGDGELRRLVECASVSQADEQLGYLKRLYESSVKYDLPELRETTVRALCECTTPANAAELLVFADLRGIECLRLRALSRATSFPELDAALVRHLCSSVDLRNVVDLAILANIHELEGLKARASEFLVANVSDVVANAGLVPHRNVEIDTIVEVLRQLVLD